MRCEDVREKLADYLADTLTDADKRLLDSHAGSCSSCNAELEELRALWVDLGGIETPRLEGSKIRAAVMAAIKWRFTMREILKATAIIVVVAGIAAGASLFLGRSEKTATPPLVHDRGPSSAPVTLVQYGDYECQTCFPYDAVINRLLQKYPDTLRYEYRHFPLTGIHPNALPAAVAAEAAAEQGKFWEMHGLLLSSQDKWRRNPQAGTVFVDLARQLGLDVNAFSRSLESSDLQQRITGAMAKADGINGTPTFVLNGKKLESTPNTFEGFDGLIVDQLKLLKLQRPPRK